MRREDCTPGLIVRYSDTYLAETTATGPERAARLVVAGPCGCLLCERGLVPVVGRRHVHPDNLEAA